MEMLNRVMVIGRLTKDPELKKTQSGYTIANFTVAADRPTKKEEKTDFINCVAWEKTADIVDRFGRKGLLVYVDGRLEVDGYKAADGSNRNLTRVNVGTFIALEKVDLRKDPHAGLQPQAGAGTERYSDDMFSRALDDMGTNIDPDQLPF